MVRIYHIIQNGTPRMSVSFDLLGFLEEIISQGFRGGRLLRNLDFHVCTFCVSICHSHFLKRPRDQIYVIPMHTPPRAFAAPYLAQRDGKELDFVLRCHSGQAPRSRWFEHSIHATGIAPET